MSKTNIGLLAKWTLASPLLLIVLVPYFSGCTLLRSHGRAMSVHDTLLRSDTLMVHDTVQHETTTVIKDSTVGIPGAELVTTIHDTLIRQGPVRLLIRGNMVDCKADSLTMVISSLQRRQDSTSVSISELGTIRSLRHSEITIQTGKSWIQRTLSYLEGLLALVGAATLLRFIFLTIIKK